MSFSREMVHQVAPCLATWLGYIASGLRISGKV